MCAFLFRRVSVTERSLLYEYRRRLRRRRERERERERECRARESVHRRRLCDQESARLQRPPRKGRLVCGTGLYRLGGKFLGLNQVIRVAGESDEDREVRLQALRTKKVLDPGSVPLVSVLVTVVSFTLTCFSSHLIVTWTDPGRGDAVMDRPRDSMVTVGMLSTSPRMWPPLFRVCPTYPLNWMSSTLGAHAQRGLR